MSTTPRAKERTMATAAPAKPARTHADLVAAINPNPDRLAGLLHDADREYNEALDKLDAQAGWIIEKMQPPTSKHRSLAGNRPLHVNAIGELQGQGVELDRLCGTVCAKREHTRRLNEVLGVEQR